MNTREYLDGKSYKGFEFFGCHKKSENSYIFRILAKNARNVYISGDFNGWSEQKLRKYSSGIFSKTIKNVNIFDRYVYIIEDDKKNKKYKIDPYSKLVDVDNENSLVYDNSYKFKYKNNNKNNINIYQINMKIIRKNYIFKDEKSMYDFIKYIKSLKFTHISLMPLHPYKDIDSLGFLPFAFFALDKKVISIDRFNQFIDLCHKENIGVILDVIINEFDPSEKSLIKFDNTNMYNYDYENILYNYNGSINFDPNKNICKSFILSYINFWLSYYNLDGVNISNIENLIYWQADKKRGFNYEWINFLEEINSNIKSMKKLSIATFNDNWDKINLDIGFDYIYDRKLDKLIKIFQKEPFVRDNYKSYIKNLIELDFRKYILGFSYYDNISENSSLAMKMFSCDKKIEQLKTLFLFLYSLNSKKMIYMGDELYNLKSFDLKKDDANFSKIYEKLDENKIKFRKFYKKLSDFYRMEKDFYNLESEVKILEIEGYSLYAFKKIYKDKRYLILLNLTDLNYKLESPYKLDIKISTNNLEEKINKGDIIEISQFSSLIAKIE